MLEVLPLVALLLGSVAAAIAVLSSRQALAAERRRSLERARVDGALIEAQARRADAAEDLAQVRLGTIDLLKEQAGLIERLNPMPA